MGASSSYNKPREVASEHYPAYVAKLPALTGHVVAVTGCTTGTGYAVCRAMAQKGAHVVMLNRPSERATAAEAQARILKKVLVILTWYSKYQGN